MEKSQMEVLEYAVACELDAQKLYGDFAKKMKDEQAGKLFEKLAEEEGEHAHYLQNLMGSSQEDIFHRIGIKDMKKYIANDELPISANASLIEIFDFAIEKEVTSFELYDYLSKSCRNEEARKMFSQLAQVEVRHKLRIEEYKSNYAGVRS